MLTCKNLKPDIVLNTVPMQVLTILQSQQSYGVDILIPPICPQGLNNPVDSSLKTPYEFMRRY